MNHLYSMEPDSHIILQGTSDMVEGIRYHSTEKTKICFSALLLSFQWLVTFLLTVSPDTMQCLLAYVWFLPLFLYPYKKWLSYSCRLGFSLVFLISWSCLIIFLSDGLAAGEKCGSNISPSNFGKIPFHSQFSFLLSLCSKWREMGDDDLIILCLRSVWWRDIPLSRKHYF